MENTVTIKFNSNKLYYVERENRLVSVFGTIYYNNLTMQNLMSDAGIVREEAKLLLSDCNIPIVLQDFLEYYENLSNSAPEDSPTTNFHFLSLFKRYYSFIKTNKSYEYSSGIDVIETLKYKYGVRASLRKPEENTNLIVNLKNKNYIRLPLSIYLGLDNRDNSRDIEFFMVSNPIDTSDNIETYHLPILGLTHEKEGISQIIVEEANKLSEMFGNKYIPEIVKIELDSEFEGDVKDKTISMKLSETEKNLLMNELNKLIEELI